MGFSKSSAKRKVHSNTSLPQEMKNQINNLTLYLKQLEKEEMENLKVTRRKEIIKIRAEINEKETKETIEKINKTKTWFISFIFSKNQLLVLFIFAIGSFISSFFHLFFL